VLVVDRREQRLRLLDFTRGSTADIGRQGSGPGEYRNLTSITALPGDTSMIPVPGAWQLLVGPEMATRLAMSRPEVAAVRGPIIGITRSGHVYSKRDRGLPCRDTPTAVADTVFVVRVSRRTAVVDTVAHLAVRPTVLRIGVMQRGDTARRCTPPPFPANDDAIAFPDGWVAVARSAPYRVDWLAPGERTPRTGTPFRVDLAPVSAADREALMDSFPPRPNRMPDFDYSNFPARLPPFQAGALFASPDGHLVIRRTTPASDSLHRYDVVDRQSQLRGQLTLPRNQAVAGFGARSVYVVTTDADGLQRLSRHPWPVRAAP
jgi:hypothetical protein